MNLRYTMFVEYSFPVDINPKEIRLRHMMDFETMSKIENKYGRVNINGKSTAKAI